MKARSLTPARPMLALALLAALGAPAFGQARSEQPGPISGLGGVRASFPTVKPLGPDNGATVSLPAPPPQIPPTFVRPPVFRHPGFPGSGFDVPLRHSGVVVTEGSGLTVNGGFTDDHFRLGFHLGSPLGFRHRFPRDHNHAFVSAPFFFSPWWYDSGYGRRYDNIYGFYAPLDPNLYTVSQPAAAPPVTITPPPSTPKELAATYLRAGDSKAAVSALRIWLVDNPRDAEAMRLLALALIDSGPLADGASTMALAYHTDPLLASRPLAPDIIPSLDRLREDVRRVSIYANRVRSSSAWLALAVLMQAEGRESTARPIVEKAKAAGLEPAVADRLLAALQ
jgi:hypothetical protein